MQHDTNDDQQLNNKFAQHPHLGIYCFATGNSTEWKFMKCQLNLNEDRSKIQVYAKKNNKMKIGE